MALSSWVNTATRTYTQQDPIGLAGGLNLYGFADGDPVNFSDPFGLNPCKSNPEACLNVLNVVASLLLGNRDVVPLGGLPKGVSFNLGGFRGETTRATGFGVERGPGGESLVGFDGGVKISQDGAGPFNDPVITKARLDPASGKFDAAGFFAGFGESFSVVTINGQISNEGVTGNVTFTALFISGKKEIPKKEEEDANDAQ